MAKYTVTRRTDSSYIDPISMTISLTDEELQTFVDALQPTGYSECIIQQLLDLINPPVAAEKTEQEESNLPPLKLSPAVKEKTEFEKLNLLRERESYEKAAIIAAVK